MKKRDKYFARLWLLSTLLVMTVVTLIVVAVYSYSTRRIKSSMAELNIKLLNQIESFSDTYVFRSAELFAAQNFISVQPGSDIDKIYSNEALSSSFLYDYCRSLVAMVNSDRFVESVHIYVPHRDMIVSSSGVRYLSDGSKHTAFTEEKKRLFERALSGERWVNTYCNSDGENIITLLVKYCPYPAAVPCAIIAVDIKEESIQSAFDSIASDKSANIAILNENGKMISNSDKLLLYEDISQRDYVRRVLESEDETGYFVSRVDGKKKLVSFFKSRYNDWSYISIRDMAAVFAANRLIFIFTVIIYIFVIILGAIGAYLISKNYYTPIGDLADFVSTVTGRSKTDNAYSFLSNEIYDIGNDIKKYKKLKADVLPIAKSNFAYELTHNRNLSADYIKKQYELIGAADDTYNAFAILSCCFADEETASYTEYGIVEYLYSLSNEERLVLCSAGIKAITVVVCAQRQEKLGVEALASGIKTAVEHMGGFGVNIFVGEIANSISEISTVYERLQNLEKYNYIYSGFNILYCNELAARERTVSMLGHEALFSQLAKQMDLKNIDETAELTAQMINTLKNGCFSYDYIHEFLFRLMEFLSGYMQERGIVTDELSKDKETLYDEYRQAENIDKMLGFVQDLCINIIYMNDGADGGYDISARVKAFVSSLPDEEMKNITLMYVADKLFLSQAYISRTFKNETGERFIDYLTNEKLERCARILRDKNVKVKEVCDMMGYSNSNYFIRKFRDKYGITPKQYQFKG